jgi:hypothetical protein
MWVFLRMAKLDRNRAVEFVTQRASLRTTTDLADYVLSVRVMQLKNLKKKALPDTERGLRRSTIGRKMDTTELDSLYAMMIREFRKDGGKDRLRCADRLIRDHFPHLKEQSGR